MTNTLETYRAALEHIRAGSDAVCTECGWMGHHSALVADSEPLSLRRVCPDCGNVPYRGQNLLAAYALAQGEEVRP